MKLSMQVGLDPAGDIVLDGDPGPPPPKGHSPIFSAHICCGQMARWIKMPFGRKVGDIVLNQDYAPLPKKGTEPPIFGPCLLCQTPGWISMPLGMEVSLDPGDIVFDVDQLPYPKRHSPQFSAHVYCSQTVACIKMKLGMEVGLGPGYTVLDGDPAPPKGAQPPIFGPCLL